jgi:translation initiation factor IF-3
LARGPFPSPQAPTRDGPRVNEEIRVPQVRLIDAAGEMIGVMSAREALIRAFDAGLDLVEISPNAVPPVCKILDYGKYKYEQQKKANEARKKQKVVEIKEIKVRPNIDDHDYDVKMRQMKGFIEEGDKVKRAGNGASGPWREGARANPERPRGGREGGAVPTP